MKTIIYKMYKVEVLGEPLKNGRWQAQWRWVFGIEGGKRIQRFIISELLFNNKEEAESYAIKDAKSYIDRNL